MRSENTKSITTYITQEEFDYIENESQRYKISRTEVIRRLIKNYLKLHIKDKEETRSIADSCYNIFDES